MGNHCLTIQCSNPPTVYSHLGRHVIGTCQLSDASNMATITRVFAGDTPCESELVGIMQSHDSLRVRNAPAEEGKILSDCQSAIALWHEARKPFFDPMLRPHHVLQLYIAQHQRHSPDSDWPCYCLPGHSDREDPDAIAEEDRPYFEAHVICDKFAPECKRIAPAGIVTGFKTDFMFVVCGPTGERCFQTSSLHAHVEELRKSPDFRAAQTRKPRTHSTGYSWRDIPIAELDLTTTQTPWDSKHAFNPFRRYKTPCPTTTKHLTQLYT
jgi:hypothetical protein